MSRFKITLLICTLIAAGSPVAFSFQAEQTRGFEKDGREFHSEDSDEARTGDLYRFVSQLGQKEDDASAEQKSFLYPRGVAVDFKNGWIYVTDTGHGRIRIFKDGALVREWGKEGRGEGEFRNPSGVAVGAEGLVYVADTGNSRIQVFTSEGKFVRMWGGFGQEAGRLNAPMMGIAVDPQGRVYVADTYNHRIQKFDASGKLITVWGKQGTGRGEFLRPFGLTVDRDGNVYVSDTDNARVQKFSGDGKFITLWGGLGVGKGDLAYPKGIVTDAQGNVYVAIDSGNPHIEKFDKNGKFLDAGGLGGGDGAAEFKHPEGIAMDAGGRLFVADSYNHRVQVFGPDIKPIAQWGTKSCGKSFCFPSSVTLGPDGALYVADDLNHRILKFDSGGKQVAQWGKRGKGEGEFDFPQDVKVDAAGFVYVADT